MSSLEMVDYINSTRKAGATELLHFNFLQKVPKVLGGAGALKLKGSYQNAQKFLGIYSDTMNRTQQLYNFPKRESMLMQMSYELQAQVFDAWEATEAVLSKKPAVALLPNFDDPIAASRYTLYSLLLIQEMVYNPILMGRNWY